MATIVSKNVHLEHLGTIVNNLVTVKEKVLATQPQENASAHQGRQEPDVIQNAPQATMDPTAGCGVNARRELAATQSMAAVPVPGGEWAQPVRRLTCLLHSQRPTVLPKVNRISFAVPHGFSS